MDPEQRAGHRGAVLLHASCCRGGGNRHSRRTHPALNSLLAARAAEGRGERARILAVDAAAEALRYIRDALVRSGYAVITTSDPEDVPRLMEEEKPHLVLLDLLLPGVDGIELMKDIRDTSDVPAIFVPAYG